MLDRLCDQIRLVLIFVDSVLRCSRGEVIYSSSVELTMPILPTITIFEHAKFEGLKFEGLH